jgi:hypothetical protein
VRPWLACSCALTRWPTRSPVWPKVAASLIHRSVQPANEAVVRLEEARVLAQVTVGRRNRAFEAGQLIGAFTDLERQLASPTEDTRAGPPSRRVPRHS